MASRTIQTDLGKRVKESLRLEMQRGQHRNRETILRLLEECMAYRSRTGIKLIFDTILDELESSEETLSSLEEQVQYAHSEIDKLKDEVRDSEGKLDDLRSDRDDLKESLEKCVSLEDFKAVVKDLD